jgi:hypothetical protein
MSKYGLLGFGIVIAIIAVGVFGYWGVTQHDLTMQIETVRDRTLDGQTKSIASGIVDGERKIIQYDSPWFIFINTDKLYLEAADVMENDKTFIAKYHCYGLDIEWLQWYSTCYEKLPLEV